MDHQSKTVGLAEAISLQRTQSELIALIAHDLGHETVHMHGVLERLRENFRNLLRGDRSNQNQRSIQYVFQLIDDATMRTRTIIETISEIRRLGYPSEDQPTLFVVEDVIEDLSIRFKSALNTRNMDIVIKHSESIRTFGVRAVLQQILCNLLLNSIDAQRGRRRQRPNAVTLEPLREGSNFLIRIQDEGPGIDRRVWRHPNDLFQLGTTTRPNGTGAGLNVARQLLKKYFQGEILLMAWESAMFQIRCPISDIDGEIC